MMATHVSTYVFMIAIFEIANPQYGLTLGNGTLNILASTSGFLRVALSLKRSISSIPPSPSTILT